MLIPSATGLMMTDDTLRKEPLHENIDDFEKRKRDHIQHALEDQNEALGQGGFNTIHLIHDALPDLNFDDITIAHHRLNHPVKTPFLISSMTAGHADGEKINRTLAEAAANRSWGMGVGSQRRQLFDESASKEWRSIRQAHPNLDLYGNIGIAQLILCQQDEVLALAESLQAKGMIVHCNALQEVIQPEGTPQFKGCWQAIEALCERLPIPVIIKETGCGFSMSTLQRLNSTGIAAVELSGLGGTHWGRIEGQRADENSWQANAANTFRHWGETTIDSLFNAVSLNPHYEIWGSGGVRSGLDAAKLLAVGADSACLAKPMLSAALSGLDHLIHQMTCIENELKVALFCTGSRNIVALQENKYVRQ